jgi:ATP-dependent Clp protease ATP-binding subunit ClpA
VEEEASSMFERFTERARKVVVLAQEEARSFGHAYIGTEHLLLGLVREDRGIAAHALGRLNVTLSGAREQLESIVGHGEDRDFAQAPFTPRSKKVLELALRESMQLGHNYIGTEHILLGLVREREGVAYRMLSNLGVEADAVYEQVIWLLGDEPSGSRAGARREAGPRGSVRHRLLFRAQVMAFEVQMRYGTLGEAVVPQTPQTVSVELDYTYTAQKTGEALLGTVDPSDLREGVARVLAGEEFVLLETGLVRAGEYILEEFPMVREITVSVTVPRAQDPGRSPGTRLSRSARR